MVYAVSKRLALLERMIYVRAVEESIAEHYATQEMRCPMHLSIGQEAPAAAVGLCLRDSDYVVSTHRGHAHYLARGGNLKTMIAELYGKETGCARGRGGSMHLIDTEVGFMGTTAIVGNSIPVGIGLGKAIQLDGTDAVACIFLGDAAIETGSFYESANFASTLGLPVLFVCENNLYSVYSSLDVRQPNGRKIYKMASAIGLKSYYGNGNDAEQSAKLIEEAVACIRTGGGPAFVELSTYRWREHCGPNYDNDIGYRTIAEFEAWKNQDPIKLLESTFYNDVTVVNHIAAYRSSIYAEIADAFAAAKAAAFPQRSEAYIDEYARQIR